MRILGDKDTVFISLDGLRLTSPYKTSSSPFYLVSIKDRDDSTLYKVLFSSLKRAKLLSGTKKQDIELIEVPLVSTESGQSTERLYFYREVCIKEYENILNSLDKYQQTLIQKIQKDKENNIVDPEYFDDEELEAEELEAEFEVFYNKASQEAQERAKRLLTSLAKYYLDAEIIDKNEFLQAKIEIEEQSVSGLIFQLDMSKIAIKKLVQKIYMDKSATKGYEALAKLQRIVVDVNESISKLVKESVKDMKDMKDRFLEQGMSQEEETAKILGEVVLSSENPNDAVEFIKNQMSIKAQPKEDTQ